jgi:flagellar protein FliO/FliZ
MDVILYVKGLCAFVFVIALMLFLSWALKKAGGVTAALKSDKRLKIVEALPIDHKHRLVLVRRDNREHLLVLGPESETVIESGIVAAENDDEQKTVLFARDQRNVKI